MTVDSFVPDQQAQKLAIIRDAAGLLDTTFSPLMVAPPPSDAEIVASLRTTAASLRTAAKTGTAAPARHALSLAGKLEALANGSGAARVRATAAFVPGLKAMLAELRAPCTPRPCSSKPAKGLLRDWVSPDGQYRVQVFPRAKSSDNKALRFFTHSVMAVAPDATGTPIIILELARTIVWAFRGSRRAVLHLHCDHPGDRVTPISGTS